MAGNGRGTSTVRTKQALDRERRAATVASPTTTAAAAATFLSSPPAPPSSSVAFVLVNSGRSRGDGCT